MDRLSEISVGATFSEKIEGYKKFVSLLIPHNLSNKNFIFIRFQAFYFIFQTFNFIFQGINNFLLVLNGLNQHGCYSSVVNHPGVRFLIITALFNCARENLGIVAAPGNPA